MLGRRKCGVKTSSVTSAACVAAPQGQRSRAPRPSWGTGPPWSGSSGPILPVCTVTPVPVAEAAGHIGTGKLPGTRAGGGAGRRGTGRQALGEGAKPGCVPAPRTPARALGAELVPAVVPGYPAPQQGCGRNRRVLGHVSVQGRTSAEGQGRDPHPMPQRDPLSPPAPRWGTAPPTCVCHKVPAVGLVLASSRGWGRRSLDLVQLRLLGRNRKPGADHTAIARFPALPPLPASPCARGRRQHTAPPRLRSPQPCCPSPSCLAPGPGTSRIWPRRSPGLLLAPAVVRCPRGAQAQPWPCRAFTQQSPFSCAQSCLAPSPSPCPCFPRRLQGLGGCPGGLQGSVLKRGDPLTTPEPDPHACERPQDRAGSLCPTRPGPLSPGSRVAGAAASSPGQHHHAGQPSSAQPPPGQFVLSPPPPGTGREAPAPEGITVTCRTQVS